MKSNILRFFQKKKMKIDGSVVVGARGGDFVGTFHQPIRKPSVSSIWFSFFDKKTPTINFTLRYMKMKKNDFTVKFQKRLHVFFI